MDQLKKLYIDKPKGSSPINVDDFIVAIGVNKSNSVYHVAEVSEPRQSPKHKRLYRYNIKVFKSDLITCLKRESNQQLIPMTWYKRQKKNVCQ